MHGWYTAPKWILRCFRLQWFFWSGSHTKLLWKYVVYGFKPIAGDSRHIFPHDILHSKWARTAHQIVFFLSHPNNNLLFESRSSNFRLVFRSFQSLFFKQHSNDSDSFYTPYFSKLNSCLDLPTSYAPLSWNSIQNDKFPLVILLIPFHINIPFILLQLVKQFNLNYFMYRIPTVWIYRFYANIIFSFHNYLLIREPEGWLLSRFACYFSLSCKP